MRDRWRRVLRTHEFRLFAVTVIIALFLSIASPGFFTLQNVVDLLTSYAFSGILAAGLLVVLVSGKIDISFTATASIAQYAAILVGNAHPATLPATIPSSARVDMAGPPSYRTAHCSWCRAAVPSSTPRSTTQPPKPGRDSPGQPSAAPQGHCCRMAPC